MVDLRRKKHRSETDAVAQVLGGSSYGKMVKIFSLAQSITTGVLCFIEVGD